MPYNYFFQAQNSKKVKSAHALFVLLISVLPVRSLIMSLPFIRIYRNHRIFFILFCADEKRKPHFYILRKPISNSHLERDQPLSFLCYVSTQYHRSIEISFSCQNVCSAQKETSKTPESLNINQY